MKRIPSFVKVILSALLLFSCKNNQADLEDLARRMAEMDGVEMSEVDEKRTAQLILKIRTLEDDIGGVIEDQNNRAEFLKLLGLKYMDYRMWSLAAETFDGAVAVTPENSRLHYYRAVCLGQQAKAESDPVRTRELLLQAEEDYLIALEIEPGYSSAAYGLAILYVYELDRVYDGERLLDDLIRTDPSFIKGLMLRARLYEADGDRGRAVELYRRVREMGRDEEMLRTAEERLKELGAR